MLVFLSEFLNIGAWKEVRDVSEPMRLKLEIGALEFVSYQLLLWNSLLMVSLDSIKSENIFSNRLAVKLEGVVRFEGISFKSATFFRQGSSHFGARSPECKQRRSCLRCSRWSLHG